MEEKDDTQASSVDLDHVLRFDRSETLGEYRDRQLYGRDFLTYEYAYYDNDGVRRSWTIRRSISSRYELPAGDSTTVEPEAS